MDGRSPSIENAVLQIHDVRTLRRMIEDCSEPSPFMAAEYARQAIDDAIVLALKEARTGEREGADASPVLFLIYQEKAFLACAVADALLGWQDGQGKTFPEAVRWLKVGVEAFEHALSAKHDDNTLLSLGATCKFLHELGEASRAQAMKWLNEAAQCSTPSVRHGALDALRDMDP